MSWKSAKPTNEENRRKSTLIVKSEDNRKNKYNYLKLNRKNKDPRSDAITELELMYDKLNEELLDSDLLDRAERRDLPCSHQLIWANDHNNNRIDGHQSSHSLVSNDLNDSPNDWYNQNDNSYQDFNKRRSMATIAALEAIPNNDHKYDQYLRPDWMSRSRTPPYRRSAIPDIIRDDFAIRKYNKSLSQSQSQSQLNSNPEICGFNSIKRINANKHYSMSYLLTTSSIDDIYQDYQDIDDIYTNGEDLKHVSKANIRVDDLSYRRIRQSPANNVLPPHPPFGIPNTIVSPSSVNDYVRAELDPKVSANVGFRCKSSIPHLIRDDMAFRSLRKDAKSPMPSLSSVPSNKSLPDISLPHIKSSRV